MVTQRTPGSIEHPKPTFIATFLYVALSAWEVSPALGETPSSTWLWMSSHCDKPCVCTEQSGTDCQERPQKGCRPNVFINILKHIRMSKRHLGLYWKSKEQVKYAVIYGRGRDQGQQLKLQIIRPNRRVCFDIWLFSKMHHLLPLSF